MRASIQGLKWPPPHLASGIREKRWERTRWGAIGCQMPAGIRHPSSDMQSGAQKMPLVVAHYTSLDAIDGNIRPACIATVG